MASKPHLEALKLLEQQIEVSGVYNRSRERAQQIAEQHGWPVFDSVEAIAADSSTDGVIVLTPPHQPNEEGV